MDDRAKTGSPLVREVEPPQRQHSGLGVMVIASAAMFFAVTSSAFLLEARTTHCPHRSMRAVTVQPAAQPTIRAAPGGETPAARATCGEAVYRHHPDGSVTVNFDLCGSDSASGSDAVPQQTPVELLRATPSN
jgi:hypothetical protein